MSKFINKHRFLSLFICIFMCTTFSVCMFCTRSIPHVDEVWSYMLSNKTDSPFLYVPAIGIGEEPNDKVIYDVRETDSYKEYFNHWHDSNYYRKAITVQSEERFSYDHVYHNQKLDVHPPLYYYILHTICSFFPDSFSWWYAFSINIAFYIGTLIMIFAIANKLKLDTFYSIIAVLLWGLSASGVNEICFLRMYMMLTFFIMCVTYLQICIMQHFALKYLIAIVIFDVLSFLTQYYAYIYIFFLTLFYIGYLLYKRKFLRAIFYGLTVLASVGIAVLLFPEVYKHIFSDIYSSGVTYGKHPSVYQSFIDMLKMVFEIYTGLNLDLFFIIPIIFIILFFGHIIILLIKLNKKENLSVITPEKLSIAFRFIIDVDKKYLHSFLKQIGNSYCKIILLAVFSASILIVNISPDMGKTTVRYLFLLLPLFSIFAVQYSRIIFSFVFRNTKKLSKFISSFVLLLCIVCVVGSHILTKSFFFLKEFGANNDEFIKNFEDCSIILVDSSHHTQAITPILMKTYSVYPADTINDSLGSVITNYDDINLNYFVVSSDKATKRIIERFLNNIDSLNYSYIGRYYFSIDYCDYYVFKIIN